MEWKLFEGDVPHVSTFEFHEHRERAPHLEQPAHKGRLEEALSLVTRVAETKFQQMTDPVFVDLGCGDGGLISKLDAAGYTVHGYDFQPMNAEGWLERGVLLNCRRLNFVEDWDEVLRADAYIITEVLEHLADPHKMVRRIRERNAHIIASSPANEHAGSHDACHAWAWDMFGYASLLIDAGFRIESHVRRDQFQVIWGTPNA